MSPFRWALSALCALTIASPACAARKAPGPDTYDVGAKPRSIAVADLDRDGHHDVIVANSGDGTLTILRGLGGGRLRSVTPVTAGGPDPSDIDPVDLDKDGDLDLVVANHETSLITVLLNDGTAKFTPAKGSPFDTGSKPHVHGVVTGDFDNDSWLDVAVESCDTGEVRLLRGGSSGLAAAIPISIGEMVYSRIGVADVLGDKLPEMLVPGHRSNTVRFIRRTDRGQLALSPDKIQLSGQPWMVLADDVSGDGRNDIVVVQTDAVSVWIAKASGSFSAARGSPFRVVGATDVATGDMNGDGIADIATGPWNGDEVTVIQGGSFAVRKIHACTRPMGLAIADLDGDRRGELLAACTTENRLIVLKWPSTSTQRAVN